MKSKEKPRLVRVLSRTALEKLQLQVEQLDAAIDWQA
jgi:hypothetical protein